jgi:transcriptional antiterminator RfaH
MSSSVRELRWYLIHCKPREDGRALEHLERQGFECYRPTRQVVRSRGGRRFTALEGLFPGYLFIRLDCIHDNWYPIRSTRGVNQIVRFNEHALPVQDGIIAGIRARLARVDPEPYLKPGERVSITEGPFSHIEAIFIANDGDERVVLLLNLVHHDQEMNFPIHSVRKLG